MKTRIATLIFIGASMLLLWPQPRAFAAASVNSSSQETSIRKLGVTLLKAQVRDKRWANAWNVRRAEFQKDFVTYINQRSSVEGVTLNREYGILEDNDTIVQNAKADGVDGVLAGIYQGQSLQLVLRSGSTGRPLLLLSIPARDISREPIWRLARAAVDSLVNSIPYRGFIVAVAPSGKEAKINLGRSQGLKIGERLEILDFDGENPTFSSPTYKVGEMKITKLTNYAAIGHITSSYGPVRPYQKLLQIPDDMPESEPMAAAATGRKFDRRVSSGLWASIGAEFFYIDTKASGSTTNLLERVFEVPPSPALAVGMGSSRLNLFVMGSSLSNASNSVTFLQGTADYQIHTVTNGKLSALTFLGVYYSNYQVTPSPNPTTVLTSTSTVAPLVEERFQWLTGLHTRAFAAAQLYYPLFSTDDLGNSSSAAKSFGGGVEGGIRYDLSEKLGLEGGLKLHYLSTQLQDTSSIDELEINLFAHVLFLF